MQPDCPVARSGYFVVLEVQKFVGRHVVGQNKAAFCLEHGRKNNTVKHDVVFTNKMEQPGFGVFPPFFPAVGQEFNGV